MAARLIFSIIILALCCSACSWDYHRSHYEPPFYNPQPGEYFSQVDSIYNSNYGPCQRVEYIIKKGFWRHMAACSCPGNWKVDSAFDKKGRLYLVIERHLSHNSSFLYDSSATFYFDRKERPIKRYISVNRVDTTYEYWQYFDKNRQLEAIQRPVIYYLLESSN